MSGSLADRLRTEARDPVAPASAPQVPARRRLASAAMLGAVALAGAGGLWATSSTGSARVAGLLLVLVAAVATGWIPIVVRQSGPPLGGAGYEPRRGLGLRVLHIVTTVLYNAGLMVLVLAALIRFGVVQAQLAPQPIRVFPLLMAGYLGLLALAAHLKLRDGTPVVHDWATRLHGIFLGVASAAVAGLAGAMLVRPTLTVGRATLGVDDLQVFVLAALLGAGTQVFLAVGLPTVAQLVSGVMRLFTAPRSSRARATPPFVYAAAIALAATVVVGYIAAQTHVLTRLGNFHDQRVGLLLLLFPLGIGFFVAASAFQIWRESRRGVFKRRIARKLRNDILVFGVSGIMGVACGTMLAMDLSGRYASVGPIVFGPDSSKDLLMLTIVGTALPLGVYLHRQNRAVDLVEARLPDFLNDLAETRRAGLTLTASLQSAASSDYGALSPEIRKMADQVSWGIPFTTALAQFAGRVKTSLVQRSCFLIIEAAKTGGSVADILKAAARDAYEIKALQSERRTTMMTYLIVLYVVFFVFLTVIAVMQTQFIPHVIAANEAVATQGAQSPFGGGTGLQQASITASYYDALMVQAIGNGIVAGVLSEGRITAGLRHVAIMALAAWALFRFAL